VVNSCISPSRLATNIFHLFEEEQIHAKTILESHQKYVRSMFIFNLGNTRDTSSRASNTAAHNSKRGKEIVFNGVTLDFAHINCTVVSLFFPVQRKYRHAP
jgi:hypothetical protein